MYEKALVVHSVLRWVAIAALVYAFGRALMGWMKNRPRTAGDRVSELFATIAVDVQLVAGVLLYFVWSPNTHNALQNMGAAMKDKELRFWAVEHPMMMVLAIVIVHVGKIYARKASTDKAKLRRATIAYGLALALVLFGTPWPHSAVARPFLRM